MTTSWLLAGEALVWLIAIAAVVVGQERRRIESVGLVLAYSLNLWLIHWPGGALYLLPWYSNLDPALVEAGFRQSAYGAMAFAAGSVLLGPIMSRRLLSGVGPELVPRMPRVRIEIVYILWGLLSYLVLIPLVGQTPTATAIVGAGWNILIVGLGLSCWRAWREGRHATFLGLLLVAGCLPFVTVVRQGFLGMGVGALLAVLTFVKTFRAWPRRSLIAAGILFGYLGLSLYGSYMRDRSEIRDVVWGGASFAESVDTVYLTVSNFEWFDPFENGHLARIDDRLNQNHLVGAAIDYLDAGGEEFAKGETVWQGVIALVPRVIWPGKPVGAGSMDLVSQYTGVPFAEDTSVGLGQVMEFYINFGTIGVVLGFVGLGILITVVDSMARSRLAVANWPGFALWYVPGLSLLQAGGSLVDITATAGAAVINVLVVNHVLVRLAGGNVGHSAEGSGPRGTRLRGVANAKSQANLGHHRG
jgi:hypothetical protein